MVLSLNRWCSARTVGAQREPTVLSFKRAERDMSARNRRSGSLPRRTSLKIPKVA